jgi:hypothetical protein
LDLIAKRKLRDTWRQAVERRSAAAGGPDTCVTAFDELVGSGMPDGEAAYAVLRDAGLLWRIGSNRDGSVDDVTD